jgi:flavin-dependent dehydrogenase
MTDVLDVVIVGGGPAGATTALSLAAAAPERTPRVVLLERARYPREKPCAGGLGRRGDVLLESLGARIDVPGVAIDGVSFRSGEGLVAASPGRIGRVVRRTEFDHALALAVRARGIEVREQVRVEAVEDEGGVAVVRTDAGPLRARAVVGADGVGSVVRKSLGLGVGRLRAQVVEVDTDPVAGDVNRSLLHFDVSDPSLRGYAWDFPTLVDGRAQVCRGIYRLKADEDDGGRDVTELLEARLRGQGVDPSTCRNKRYAERGYEPESRVASGRRMLVGEAAGIDPVTGEGIAQAIEYGVIAGRYLARVFSTAGGAPVELTGWGDELGHSRLARDLRIRTRFVPMFYGPSRPELERFLADTPDVLHVGGQHFAAQPLSWLRLANVLARGSTSLVGLRLAGLLVAGLVGRA